MDGGHQSSGQFDVLAGINGFGAEDDPKIGTSLLPLLWDLHWVVVALGLPLLIIPAVVGIGLEARSLPLRAVLLCFAWPRLSLYARMSWRHGGCHCFSKSGGYFIGMGVGYSFMGCLRRRSGGGVFVFTFVFIFGILAFSGAVWVGGHTLGALLPWRREKFP